jgi:hypothetical protein
MCVGLEKEEALAEYMRLLRSARAAEQSVAGVFGQNSPASLATGFATESIRQALDDLIEVYVKSRHGRNIGPLATQLLCQYLEIDAMQLPDFLLEQSDKAMYEFRDSDDGPWMVRVAA